MLCRRYKENPNIANESVHAQAREALKKYLHYFERVSRYDKSQNFFDSLLLFGSFSVGEPLAKFETRGCDAGKNQKPYPSKEEFVIYRFIWFI